MPGHVGGVADDVDRQALLGAGLGDVEAGPVVEVRRARRAATWCSAWAGSAGTSSRQRTQPARARCITRCRPEALMSRNLPCRVTSSTRVPSSADSGGSKVFSALNAAMSTRAIARSASRPRRSRARRFHLGQLGHADQSRRQPASIELLSVVVAPSTDRCMHRRCSPPAARRRGRSSSTPAVAAARCGSPGTTSPGWSCCRCGARTSAPASFRLAGRRGPRR